jgi:hypothetical protein
MFPPEGNIFKKPEFDPEYIASGSAVRQKGEWIRSLTLLDKKG